MSFKNFNFLKYKMNTKSYIKHCKQYTLEYLFSFRWKKIIPFFVNMVIYLLIWVLNFFHLAEKLRFFILETTARVVTFGFGFFFSTLNFLLLLLENGKYCKKLKTFFLIFTICCCFQIFPLFCILFCCGGKFMNFFWRRFDFFSF